MIPLWQFMIGICVGVVTVLMVRPRPIECEERPTRTAPRPKETIIRPIVKKKPENLTKPGHMCTVCNEELKIGNMHYLDCTHAVHEPCYKQVNAKCPMNCK